MDYAKMKKLPNCDSCKEDGIITPAKYDGATTRGSWAYMCDDHFMKYGRGLGTGRGQKLIVDSNRVEDIMDMSSQEIELSSEPFYFATLDSIWEMVQEEYGAKYMTNNLLISFYSYTNEVADIGYNKVMEWAKKRFPELFI